MNNQKNEWELAPRIHDATLFEAVDNSPETAVLMIVHKGLIAYQFGDVTIRYKCNSIRKTLLSALIGIYVEEGLIHLNQTISDLNINDKLGLTTEEQSATVLDLLMGRSGIYHPTHHETDYMINNKPPRYSHPPGTHWVYNNWDFNALGTIFEKCVENSIFQQFKEKIAIPIGMQDFRYDETNKDGEYVHSEFSIHPAYTFKMSTRDLARFGLLFLHQGNWQGSQIISKDYVRSSTYPHSLAGNRGAYGYMWWVETQGVHFPGISVPTGTYSARGGRGHYLVVIPSHELVIVHRVNSIEGNTGVGLREFGDLLSKILSINFNE